MRRMHPRQAAALVAARLGRAPQDAVEATVVLEAWCGVPTPEAIALGEQLVGEVESSERVRPPREEAVAERWRLSEQIALLVALVALMAWSAPLITAVGGDVFELTWKLAVPLTLLMQWGLRRRYLAGRDGLGRLRRGVPLLLTGAVALPLLLAAVAGTAGVLGGLLVVIWVAAMVVGRRGWGFWYAAWLVAVAFALWEGLPAMPTMVAAACGGVALAAGSLLGTELTSARPARWRRVFVAGCLGGALGLMLILDGSVQWTTSGALPALVLLPSVLGGLWGSAYLGNLWTALPMALRVVSLRDGREVNASGRAAAIVGGAALRLVATTLVLSLAVALGPWARGVSQALIVSLLAGFAVVALATLAVILHDAFGRPGWALAAVLCGVAGEFLLRLGASHLQAGAGLMLGGGIVLLVLLPPTVALIRQPARTIATVVNVR